MALHYFNQRTKVIEELNRIHGTNFRPEDVLFEDVQAVSALVPRPTTACNTRVTLRAGPALPATGQRYAFYNRTDLAYACQYWPVTTLLPLRAWYPKTTHDLLPLLARQWGLPFQPEDILDEPLTLVDSAGSVTIRCAPGAPNFVGQLTFKVVRGGGSLEAELKTKDLTGLSYLDPNVGSKQAAELYSYRYDFTAHHALLATATPGVLDDALQSDWAAMLAAVTGHTWVGLSTHAPYNVSRMEILSNGLNNQPFGTNPSYKYVLRARLSAGCSNLAGVLQLHYNDPLPV